MNYHPIHHITAIASDAKECVNFYRKILGLRLVKKSVNQDQVEAYHLFFGDNTGEPGMDLTFFTFPGLHKGSHGTGVVSRIDLSIPKSSISYWEERFDGNNIDYTRQINSFGQEIILFADQDDQKLCLVGRSDNEITAAEGVYWKDSPVPQNHSIRCFDGAILSVTSSMATDLIITKVLGFVRQEVKENHHLYTTPENIRGGSLIIDEQPSMLPAVNAAGTVHHIAFQVEDENELMNVRQKAIDIGLYPTEVIDRYYFKSVYFRTPAGILFELATNGPGFTVDEDEKSLGEKLALPPFLESQRTKIESQLIPID